MFMELGTPRVPPCSRRHGGAQRAHWRWLQPHPQGCPACRFRFFSRASGLPCMPIQGLSRASSWSVCLPPLHRGCAASSGDSRAHDQPDNGRTAADNGRTAANNSRTAAVCHTARPLAIKLYNFWARIMQYTPETRQRGKQQRTTLTKVLHLHPTRSTPWWERQPTPELPCRSLVGRVGS